MGWPRFVSPARYKSLLAAGTYPACMKLSSTSLFTNRIFLWQSRERMKRCTVFINNWWHDENIGFRNELLCYLCAVHVLNIFYFHFYFRRCVMIKMKGLTTPNVEPTLTAWLCFVKPSGSLIHFTLSKNWQKWLFLKKTQKLLSTSSSLYRATLQWFKCKPNLKHMD